MEFNYGELAKNSLKSFAATVGEAIKKNHYDLLLAGGDSGNIVAWITEEVYRALGQAPPKKIVLPTYRHSDEAETILFDNRALGSLINPADVESLQKVLVVDDEVGSGNTIRGILDSLAEVSDKRPEVTFIAENEEFDTDSIPDWKIDFLVPQPKVRDVWNTISYIIPKEFETPTRGVLATVLPDLNDKQVMATLLDLPIKVWNDGNPAFTMEYRDLCATKIASFKNLQADFQDYMKGEIRKSLA